MDLHNFIEIIFIFHIINCFAYEIFIIQNFLDNEKIINHNLIKIYSYTINYIQKSRWELDLAHAKKIVNKQSQIYLQSVESTPSSCHQSFSPKKLKFCFCHNVKHYEKIRIVCFRFRAAGVGNYDPYLQCL